MLDIELLGRRGRGSKFTDAIKEVMEVAKASEEDEKGGLVRRSKNKKTCTARLK